MYSIEKKRISTGSKPVSGDLDGLKGLQLTSDGCHKIYVREESWIPWLVFSDLWNAANAYNLALISTLSYADQLADENGYPVQTGDPGQGQAVADFLQQNLCSKESRLVPGTGSLPLLTRSVRRGDHFQDLRFWDAANIRQEGDPDVDPAMCSL